MADLGDPCRECGRPLTELTAGGTVAYCWYCEDRAADGDPREWPDRYPTIPSLR